MDTHKISDGFEIGPDQMGSRLIMGKCCDHSSAFNFEWIFFILAYNKDNYKRADEFEFCQDPINNY